MVQYRLLERFSIEQGWQPDGIAYTKEIDFLFFFRGSTLRLQVQSLEELGDTNLPLEEGVKFRWGPVQVWSQKIPFDPKEVMSESDTVSRSSSTLNYKTILDQPDVYDRLLDTYLNWSPKEEALFKDLFADLIDRGAPINRRLVLVFVDRWRLVDKDSPPFSNPVHNVAVLLYARAYGLKRDELPEQSQYLEQYQDLYAPLFPEPAGWGTRACMSQHVLASPDSPVLQVWVFKQRGITTRLLIAGRGLAEFRETLLSNALLTSLRVQASHRDLLNDGLIWIERSAETDRVLDIELPAQGADAPLSNPETADVALGQLVQWLTQLSQETGFVSIHEADLQEIDNLQDRIRNFAGSAIETDQPILWAPGAGSEMDGDELVYPQAVWRLPREKDGRVEPLKFELSIDLLDTQPWMDLRKAYQDETNERVALDIQLRLELYKRHLQTLVEQKKQWDSANEPVRLERWGPTITLNQEFDEKTGLFIWLPKPDIKSTKEYFEANVPRLINLYSEWAEKMEKMDRDLETATKRLDQPFKRLITTRLFDAALRGLNIEDTSIYIQKLYQSWAKPMADLLQFLLRNRIRQLNAQAEDLSTRRTVFALELYVKKGSPDLVKIEIVPYMLLDARRSVILLDPARRFLVVKDASDFPRLALQPTEDIPVERLWNASSDGISSEQLAEMLRKAIIADPTGVISRVIDRLKPPIDDRGLAQESNEVFRLYNEFANSFQLSRLINLATNAMNAWAIITVRTSLEAARRALPGLIPPWQSARQARQMEFGENNILANIPNINELECRLYLIQAVGECESIGFDRGKALDSHQYLPSIFRVPPTASHPEIHQALEAAYRADPAYTQKWIKSLRENDTKFAYSSLMRDLPTEEELVTPKQHSAIMIMDALRLVEIARKFRQAAASLNSRQESRAQALVKLGPSLAELLEVYPGNVVHNEALDLLEILSRRRFLLSERG